MFNWLFIHVGFFLSSYDSLMSFEFLSEGPYQILLETQAHF